MAVGRKGYVGCVRLKDDSINVAAAVDKGFLPRHSEPHEALNAILTESHLPNMAFDLVSWKGTPALTRRMSRPASTRVLVLGDATGYVEPFTGEGIAWAITSGTAAATVVRDAKDEWDRSIELRWKGLCQQLIGRHQWTCQVLAKTLRSRRTSLIAASLLSWVPGLAAPLIRRSSLLPSHVKKYFQIKLPIQSSWTSSKLDHTSPQCLNRER